MTRPDIAGIAPFFIVRNVPAALSFYRDRLGFEVTFQGPEPDDIFFGIVKRVAATIILEAIGVEPTPNYTRDVKKGCPLGRLPQRRRSGRVGHGILVAQRRVLSTTRGATYPRTTMMACGDSKSRTPTDTSCFSVVLVHEPTRKDVS